MTPDNIFTIFWFVQNRPSEDQQRRAPFDWIGGRTVRCRFSSWQAWLNPRNGPSQNGRRVACFGRPPAPFQAGGSFFLQGVPPASSTRPFQAGGRLLFSVKRPAFRRCHLRQRTSCLREQKCGELLFGTACGVTAGSLREASVLMLPEQLTYTMKKHSRRKSRVQSA